MELLPNGDRIIIEPIKESSTAKTGLVIPFEQQEKVEKGKILFVGFDVPKDFKVGDIVLYRKCTGDEIIISNENKKLKILHTPSIQAKIIL